MREHWTERLSEYLDGELSGADARGLEAHVQTCADCAATLRDLQEIVGAARRLPEADAGATPEPDLWPAIESRLTPRAHGIDATGVVSIGSRRQNGRRIAFSVPQLAAAGLALMLFSATGVWLALGGPGPTRPDVALTTEAPITPATATMSATFISSWEAAIEDMESELARRRAELEPGTIQVVERNLAIIDQAIAEARRALEADPSSAFLRGYVAETMRRKVDLLRQATRIQRTET